MRAGGACSASRRHGPPASLSFAVGSKYGTMAIPPELDTEQNRAVLAHLYPLSAHSDVVEVLMKAVEPLGDVQTFCPDPHEYRYVVVSTRNVVFGFARGM